MILLVPALLALTACSSSEDTATTATETSESVAAPSEPELTCPDPVAIDEQDVAAAVNSVSLASGQVTTVRVSTDSDHPGEQAIAIDLCILPTITVDELRPIATEYAKAIKASPLADTTFAVYVSNYAYGGGGNDVVDEVKVKDGDFHMHLWNGKPSESAELERWEVIAG